MELELHSESPQQTRAIGAALGRALLRLQSDADAPPAHVLLLSGDYGSGKTTFVQGLAAALGIEGAVRSPSYLIVKLYNEGALRLVHADLYRSGSQADVAELGLEDLLADGGLLAVEWPGENLPLAEELPTMTLRLYVGAAEMRPVPSRAGVSAHLDDSSRAAVPGRQDLKAGTESRPTDQAGTESRPTEEAEQRSLTLEWSEDCIGLLAAFVEELRHAPATR